MEERFDEEFKRKVKGIDPEIPEIVKSRINDTLASLPVKRNLRKFGYLSTIAAVFVVCFIGIRYIYPMKLANESNAKKDASYNVAANNGAGERNTQEVQSSPSDNSASTQKSVENTKADESNVLVGSNRSSENTAEKPKSITPKTAAASQPDTTNTQPEVTTTDITLSSAKMGVTFTSADSRVAADQGITLTLKTAAYDGKEIRIEFDRATESSNALADSTTQDDAAAAGTQSSVAAKYAGIDATVQYDVRITINDIPLKCSVNVIENPMGENKYSNTMIIIPDSGLPDSFDMKLNFDRIGETSGQWLLITKVSKQ